MIVTCNAAMAVLHRIGTVSALTLMSTHLFEWCCHDAICH